MSTVRATWHFVGVVLIQKPNSVVFILVNVENLFIFAQVHVLGTSLFGREDTKFSVMDQQKRIIVRI